ncbi:MAG: hypothetical protein HZA49_09770 [Planctomycetes bacterium]|nr:hypothetical protein [Planctomycetota bacterium]
MPRLSSILFCLIILAGCAKPAKQAEVTVFVPPVFKARPEIIVIATVPEVYYVKGYVNIFFYDNLWYYFANNSWYVSYSYNGPWGVIEAHRLPVRFGQIPPGHLRVPPGQEKSRPNRDKNMPPGLGDKDDDDDGPPGHGRKGK